MPPDRRRPLSETTLVDLRNRWERLPESFKFSVACLIIDLVGSSELTDKLTVEDAHCVKEAFRVAVINSTRRWGTQPTSDWNGDSAAFLFFEVTHALQAAIDILA